MKSSLRIILRNLLCITTVMAAAGNASPETLYVVVNRSNPVDNLSRAQLRKLMLGEIRQWTNSRRVTIVQREPESQTFQHVLDAIVRMSASEYKRYLMQLQYRGEEALPVKTLLSSEAAARFVYNVPGAVAVLDQQPTGELTDRVKVVRVDGKLPSEGSYSLR